MKTGFTPQEDVKIYKVRGLDTVGNPDALQRNDDKSRLVNNIQFGTGMRSDPANGSTSGLDFTNTSAPNYQSYSTIEPLNLPDYSEDQQNDEIGQIATQYSVRKIWVRFLVNKMARFFNFFRLFECRNFGIKYWC